MSRISLRSAFRPVRVLPEMPDHHYRRMPTGPDSCWKRFRRDRRSLPSARRWRYSPSRALDADGWHRRLTPAQQAFVAQTRNLPGTAVQFLAHSGRDRAQQPVPPFFGVSLQAAGSATRPRVRSACLDAFCCLQIPDRLSQFEESILVRCRSFERHRIQALAAEGEPNWRPKPNGSGEAAVAATSVDDGDDRQAKLSPRVSSCGHLAQISCQAPRDRGRWRRLSRRPGHLLPGTRWWCQTDPDYVAGVLELIGHYRAGFTAQGIGTALVDEAVQRFPRTTAPCCCRQPSRRWRGRLAAKAAGFAHSAAQDRSESIPGCAGR